MSYRFMYLLVIAISLLLSGCAAHRCANDCFVCPPLTGNCYIPGSECEKRCVTPCYDNCRRCRQDFGCGKCGLINELASQGVQVVELGQRVTIIIFTDNCIRYDRVDVDVSCTAPLNNIIKLIKNYESPVSPIKVTAYTDHIGDVCCKRELSQHVADLVVGYLWAHDLPLDSMVARGASLFDPVASVHTTCGNAYNRRVEINFFSGNCCSIPCSSCFSGCRSCAR